MTIPPTRPATATILSVSQLNHSVSQVLGERFFSVWVAGEVSNLSAPVSGHWYFSLKDANAQVRCAFFKNQQRRQSVKPENGKQVVVKAQVSLYEPRGDYQLIVETLQEAGDGLLQQAFEALKIKLADQGLFAAEHKQPLPTLPQCVGVITSPTGAALHDMLTVLNRRFAAIPVVIYPVTVQGGNAKSEIAKAIATANQRGDCDVLIVGRGGGSLEDLWAFNEEMVARAIFASRIPVISAVGHETDVTIADFVADLRAATPSAAAEHAVPDQRDWLVQFKRLENRLASLFFRKLQHLQQTLDWLGKRLQPQHPGQKLARNTMRLNELQGRLQQAACQQLRHKLSLTETSRAKLWQFHPAIKINLYQQQHRHLQSRLPSAFAKRLDTLQQRLLSAGQTLHAVSPLATLNRGYALVLAPETGHIVSSSTQLTVGECVEVKLADGHFNSTVEKIVSTR